MKTQYDSRPIGIFDSGVGGLTVLKELLAAFPNENFIYLGDTARVPYGAKSTRTIERYTIQVADFLIRRNVKGLVAACNTASALGLGALRAHCDTPVLGVIQPGCQQAMEHIKDKNSHIGIIGTRSTIASGAYPNTLALFEPQLKVSSLACPLFVPLVEEGWLEHTATRIIVEENLAPFIKNPVDILILGCTHYPVLKPVIAQILGKKTILIDSAEAVSESLGKLFKKVILPTQNNNTQMVEFYVTDVADRFQEVAGRFLDSLNVASVEMVDL
ncbi:MAG: glutamate racemase [Magnetococcales bacterium]|nr:glutamate racemase [Magnetococcales bacterium]